MSVDAIGTLADVCDARRALLAVFEPRWVRGLVCVAGPVLLAVLAAPDGSAAVAAGAVLLAGQIALLRWQYTRAVRPQPIRLWSTRVYVVWFGLVAAFLAVLTAARAVLPYPQAAAVMFVVGVVLLTAGHTVAWHSDPFGLAELGDEPAVWDPLIGPRQPLAVCAVLAAVDAADAGLLARTVRLSGDGLDVQTAGLRDAGYLDVVAEGPRRWVGLTPAGRVAYRGHLAALRRA